MKTGLRSILIVATALPVNGPVPVVESVAVTVKVELISSVGVPLMTPPVVMFSPGGRLPAVTANVYGATPPVAVMVAPGYGKPVLPLGRFEALTMIVGAPMTSV